MSLRLLIPLILFVLVVGQGSYVVLSAHTRLGAELVNTVQADLRTELGQIQGTLEYLSRTGQERQARYCSPCSATNITP